MQTLQIGKTPTVAAELPQETPAPSPDQFATVTHPVAVLVPYGQATLQPGMKLKIVSQNADTVVVRYLDRNYPIPRASTDLK
jgi:hypothetical protein